MENLSWVLQKQERKEHMKRLSFVTQFKIEFLLLFTDYRKMLYEKCLEKCLTFLKTNSTLDYIKFYFI